MLFYSISFQNLMDYGVFKNWIFFIYIACQAICCVKQHIFLNKFKVEFFLSEKKDLKKEKLDMLSEVLDIEEWRNICATENINYEKHQTKKNTTTPSPIHPR